MTISIRISVDILSDSKYWDNDLGWAPKSEIIESGQVYQSDKFQDEAALNILEKCSEVWDDGDYVHGILIKENLVAGIFIWLSNPKLEQYPLLPNSDKHLSVLQVV